MKKFFGFGSSTPPPPPPPSRPPSPPIAKAPAPPKQAAPPPKPAAPSIVGKWKEPNASDTTEFRADGSVIERPANGDNVNGRYSLEGETLKVKLDGVADELAFTISLTQDTLEMKYPDGQATIYQRV